MNIFDKIAIFIYINKNKNNITYHFQYDDKGIVEQYDIKISTPSLISIQMDKSPYKEPTFCLEYIKQNMYGAHSYKIQPNEQSFFDKIFITKMFNTMLNYYKAKNHIQKNDKSR